MNYSFQKKSTIIIACLFIVIPLQAMFSRTSKTVHKPAKPKSKPSMKHQKKVTAAATQKVLQQRAQLHLQREDIQTPIESIKPLQDKPYRVEARPQINEPRVNQPTAAITQGAPVEPTIAPPLITEYHAPELTVHHKIVNDDKKKDRRWFSSGKTSTATKGSFSALLAALGLGWLWSSSEDEEKTKEEEIEGTPITLEEFVKRFAPPKEIQETIEAHKDALVPCSVKPYLIKGTNPPIYHKCWGIDRIINAEMLKEVIKQNHLNIEIPNKYIYPNPNNGAYEVFAEGVLVQPLGDTPLTLKEIQELTTLTVETRYADFNKENVLRNPKNKKLVLIDTENISFAREASKAGCVERLLYRFDRGDLKVRKDVRDWVENYLKKLKNGKEGQEVVDLYALPRYNKINISAGNAKKLQSDLLKQNRGQEGLLAKALWYMKKTMKSR